MKKQFLLIVTLIIEMALLLVIAVFLLIGLLGIFLPVLPGLVLISLGVALYGYLLQNEKNKIVQFTYYYVVRTKKWAIDLKNKFQSYGVSRFFTKKKGGKS